MAEPGRIGLKAGESPGRRDPSTAERGGFSLLR
jgi:hypothetical protein